MKSVLPTPQHEAFMGDLKAAIARHPRLTPPEMLALTAQLVGNLIALQDQRRMTPDMAIQLVSENIEIGNRAVIDGLHSTKGNA